LFYDRGHDSLPREWINKMKASMFTICPVFNTNRMIEEYSRKFYVPADQQYKNVTVNNFDNSKKIAEWKKKLVTSWKEIKILGVEDNVSSDIVLESDFNVKAKVRLGSIQPDDVSVQVYCGKIDSKNRMSETLVSEMKLSSHQDGTCVYEGHVKAEKIGHCGYVIRVLPKYEGKVILVPGLLTWQNG